MKKIIINLSNRWLYTFIAIGIILIIGVGVYAAVDKTTAWHPADQIEGVQKRVTGTCNGQVITGINEDGTVVCEVDDAGGADTNANTECSGTYMYLSGEGQCRDVRADGDIYDTDTNTHGSLVCTTRGALPYKSCGNTCSAYGEACVNALYSPDENKLCGFNPGSAYTYLTCRCCKVV